VLYWNEDEPNGARDSAEAYSPGAFRIKCYSLDFDGHRYGPKDQVFIIRKYEGEKDIKSLPYFPLDCDPEGAELRSKLHARGNKFADLSLPNTATNRHHKMYKGLTIGERQQEHVCKLFIRKVQAILTKTG